MHQNKTISEKAFLSQAIKFTSISALFNCGLLGHPQEKLHAMVASQKEVAEVS